MSGEKQHNKKHGDSSSKRVDKPKRLSQILLATGVTGNTGGATLRAVLASKESLKFSVRAGSRDPAKAQDKFKDLPAEQLARITWVKYDSADEVASKAAFADVTLAVIVMPQIPTGRGEELKKQTTLALNSGVGHVVTLTALVLERPESKFGQAMVGWKEFVEANKNKLTDLRLNFFMDNFLAQQNAIKHADAIYLNLPTGTYAHIAVQDIGSFAAAVLLKGKKHIGKVYYPSGPLNETLQQLAEAAGRGIGRPVKGVAVPSEAVIKSMTDVGLPLFAAEGFADLNELAASGAFVEFEKTWQQSKVFEHVVGRPQITTESWFKAVAQAFAKP